jgi:autotransporter translocation and assembly factor TamB
VRKLVALASVHVLAGLLVLGTSVSAAAPTGSAPSFAPARNYGTGGGPTSVAIGDLNGDGKPDLVTANVYGNSASVLLNRGEGRLRQGLLDERVVAHPAATLTTSPSPRVIAKDSTATPDLRGRQLLRTRGRLLLRPRGH